MLDAKACLYFAEIEDELIFTDFYNHVCQFLSTVVQSGMKRLPIQDQVIKTHLARSK